MNFAQSAVNSIVAPSKREFDKIKAGQKIRAMRQKKKVSQADLARAIGDRVQTLNHWELGVGINEIRFRQVVEAINALAIKTK